MIPIEKLQFRYFHSIEIKLWSSILAKEIPKGYSPRVVSVSSAQGNLEDGVTYQFPDDDTLSHVFSDIAPGVSLSVYVRMPNYFVVLIPRGMHLTSKQKASFLAEISGRTLQWQDVTTPDA